MNEDDHNEPNAVLHPDNADVETEQKDAHPPRVNARTSRGARARAEGTTPSITVPSTSAGYVLQCLGHGVDSLYVSHKGRLSDVYAQILPDLKQAAQSDSLAESNQAQLMLGNHIFEVKPKGRGKHPFVIVDNAFHISICDGSGSLPYTYTQILSEYLSHAGVEKALSDLNACVDDMAEYVSYSTPSRVDICCDIVTDYPFHLLTEDSFSTRSRTFVYYADHGFEGIKIGKGEFVFRVYEKTKEIKVSHKFYMRDIWKQAGWDGKSKVYRLEFQLNGTLLKRLGIATIDQLLPKIPELWAHCCMHRLRLLAPGNHQSRHRRPTEPLWEKIAGAFGACDALPLKKHYSSKRIPPDYYLFGHGIGPVLSYMAIEGIDDMEEGFRAFREGVMRYHRLRHSDPDALQTHLRRKIAERRKKYNIRFNDPDSEDGEGGNA